MRALVALAAAAVACGIGAAACTRALPEEGSEVANLYVVRCGTGCHRPYHPGTMTSAMWELQLKRMEPVIRKAGLPPLGRREASDLLAYLQRNSEGHGR